MTYLRTDMCISSILLLFYSLPKNVYFFVVNGYYVFPNPQNVSLELKKIALLL